MKKKSYVDMLVIGFALFSMFFGAGNLIFPPAIGFESGSHWFLGFASFIIADAGLALVTLIATARGNGTIEGVTHKFGKIPSLLLGTLVVLCIGPLMAIPRTAATTYEMAIQPNFGSINPLIISIIYFAITLALTIRPSKVVDIIGKFLTPALLIALLALIVVGIVTPLGPIAAGQSASATISDGLVSGYQSMDVLGGLALALIIMVTLNNKGYTKSKEQVKMIAGAGIVAGIGLGIVYCGLTYLGATASSVFGQGIARADLLLGITNGLLGRTGTIILGIIVAVACLTTSVGLVSACSEYFSKLSKNKIKYEYIVIGLCVFSTIVSIVGIDAIVKFSTPILGTLYPAVLTLVGLSFTKIKNTNVHKFATWTAIAISILTQLVNYGVNIPVVGALPLSSVGLNWIIPAVIMGCVGAFIKPKNKMNKENEIIETLAS